MLLTLTLTNVCYTASGALLMNITHLSLLKAFRLCDIAGKLLHSCQTAVGEWEREREGVEEGTVNECDVCVYVCGRHGGEGRVWFLDASCHHHTAVTCKARENYCTEEQYPAVCVPWYEYQLILKTYFPYYFLPWLCSYASFVEKKNLHLCNPCKS